MSIRETARLVDRDLTNGEELTELVRLASNGTVARSNSFPYEKIVISLPFDRDDVRDGAQRRE